MTHAARALLALGLLGPLCALAAAPLDAPGWLALARLSPPAISADGKLAVVPVTRDDPGSGRSSTNLWLVPLAGGDARLLTTDAAAATDPAFSPDGRYVAFVSQRAGDADAQLYVIALAGGEARRVTDLPTGAHSPKWFADSRRLAFISNVWPDLVRWEDQRQRLAARRAGGAEARLLEHAPIVVHERLLDERQAQLFAIAVEGGEPTAITRGSGYALPPRGYSANSFALSPDGLEVMLVADTDPAGATPRMELIALPACGCKPARPLAQADPAAEPRPAYSPDGRYVAFLRRHGQLALYDRRDGVLRDPGAGFDGVAAEFAWNADSRSLLVLYGDAATAAAGARGLYRIAAGDAAPRALTPATGPAGAAGLSGLAAAGPDAIALRESPGAPAMLVRLDPRSGEARVLLDFNAAALERVAPVRSEGVTIPAAGAGLRIWLTYPPGFDPARRYPVVMLVNDGGLAAADDRRSLRWNARVIAGWGYLVGAAEVRAAGRSAGDRAAAYQDAVAAARWLAAQPFVDRERMVSAGEDFGGYLAAMLADGPQPLRALIVQRPDAPPPAVRSDHRAPPTLVIDGGMGGLVSPGLGVSYFDRLQALGVASRLLYFARMEDGMLGPGDLLLWYRSVRGWLESEAAPGPRR